MILCLVVKSKIIKIFYFRYSRFIYVTVGVCQSLQRKKIFLFFFTFVSELFFPR